MRLSDAAVRKPVFAWMLMAGLIVFGALGFRELGVSRMPDVDFPQVTVSLTLEGASPETMETDVVELVEDACMSVEGIVDISSSSQQGRATVTLEFEVGRVPGCANGVDAHHHRQIGEIGAHLIACTGLVGVRYGIFEIDDHRIAPRLRRFDKALGPVRGHEQGRAYRV